MSSGYSKIILPEAMIRRISSFWIALANILSTACLVNFTCLQSIYNTVFFGGLKTGGSAWESNPPAALSDGTPDLKSGSPTSELSTSVDRDYKLPDRPSQANLRFQEQVMGTLFLLLFY
jgi:hypothetical protein